MGAMVPFAGQTARREGASSPAAGIGRRACSQHEFTSLERPAFICICRVMGTGLIFQTSSYVAGPQKVGNSSVSGRWSDRTHGVNYFPRHAMPPTLESDVYCPRSTLERGGRVRYRV